MASNVVNAVESIWEKENIPDADLLYMRVHRDHIDDGDVMPRAFRDQGDGMSTNWNKYSTPEYLKQTSKVPADNAIIEMNVGTIRNISGQSVEHSPIQNHTTLPDNRAHTDVIGYKRSTEVRALFAQKFRMLIPIKEN